MLRDYLAPGIPGRKLVFKYLVVIRLIGIMETGFTNKGGQRISFGGFTYIRDKQKGTTGYRRCDERVR